MGVNWLDDSRVWEGAREGPGAVLQHSGNTNDGEGFVTDSESRPALRFKGMSNRSAQAQGICSARRNLT
jgi:hypothetical protein